MKEETQRDLQGLLAHILILSIALACEISGLVLGWGLHPKNWFWIIGIGFFANLTVRALGSALEKKKP